MSALVVVMFTQMLVMAGLVPAIHVLAQKKDVDARHKAGHDGGNRI
jgi:hypothetical protein